MCKCDEKSSCVEEAVLKERNRIINIINSEPNYPKGLFEEVGFWAGLYIWFNYVYRLRYMLRLMETYNREKIVKKINA